MIDQLARLEHIFDNPGAAQILGFEGFTGRSVIEIGSGSGEFSHVALKLGAISLTCVEPQTGDTSQYPDDDRLRLIQKTLKAAINADEVDASDIVLVYNLAPNPERAMILRHLPSVVAKGGQLVITTAERGLFSPVLEIEAALKDHFQSVNSSNIRPSSPLGNNNLIIANSRV